MGGRLCVRRLLATTLGCAALVLVLLLLPSAGSSSVPAAVLAGSPPAAAVVHLLADEIAPPATSAPIEVRNRSVAPDHTAVLVVLAALVGGLAVAGDRRLADGRHHLRAVVIGAAASGRAPPRRLHAT